jgi:hypothetical protein
MQSFYEQIYEITTFPSQIALVVQWCFDDTPMQEQGQAQSAVSIISWRKFVLAR